MKDDPKNYPPYASPEVFESMDAELDWLIRQAKTLLKENEKKAKILNNLIQKCRISLRSIDAHQAKMDREFRKNKRLYEKKFLEQTTREMLLDKARKTALKIIDEANQRVCQEQLVNMETVNEFAS